MPVNSGGRCPLGHRVTQRVAMPHLTRIGSAGRPEHRWQEASPTPPPTVATPSPPADYSDLDPLAALPEPTPESVLNAVTRGSLAVPTLRLAEGVPPLLDLLYGASAASSVLDVDIHKLPLPARPTIKLTGERVLAAVDDEDDGEDARVARVHALMVAGTTLGAVTVFGTLIGLVL